MDVIWFYVDRELGRLIHVGSNTVTTSGPAYHSLKSVLM